MNGLFINQYGRKQFTWASLHRPQNFELRNIVLAAKLLEERVVDLCPFKTYEEDIAHYQYLKAEVERCSLNIYTEHGWSASELLCEKIIETINKNMKLSFEGNKTSEDLYSEF